MLPLLYFFRRCCFFLSLNIYRLLFHREILRLLQESFLSALQGRFYLRSLVPHNRYNRQHHIIFFFVIVHFSLDQRSQYLHQNRQRVYLFVDRLLRPLLDWYRRILQAVPWKFSLCTHPQNIIKIIFLLLPARHLDIL